MHPAGDAPRKSRTPQQMREGVQQVRQVVQEMHPNRKEPSLRATVKRDSPDFSSWPSIPSEQVLADWLVLRKRKRADNSKTAMSRIGAELHKALGLGFSVEDCISEAVARSWQGFKADWMHPDKTNGASHAQANQPRPSNVDRIRAAAALRKAQQADG
jgi:hypothetical protein